MTRRAEPFLYLQVRRGSMFVSLVARRCVLLLTFCCLTPMTKGQTVAPKPLAKPTFSLGSRVEDFREAAENALPPVASLYSQLQEPYDIITVGNKSLKVSPLRPFLKIPSGVKDAVVVEILQAKQGRETKEISPNTISEFRPFEGMALQKVNKFLGDEKVPEVVRWRVAQHVLVAVLRFHDARRHHPILGPDPWRSQRRALHTRLIEVRIGYLRSLRKLAKSTNNEKAAAWRLLEQFATQLERIHSTHPGVRTEVATSRFGYVQHLLDAPQPEITDYIRVQRLLPKLVQSPDPKGMLKSIDQKLIAKAKVLYEQAKGLKVDDPRDRRQRENLLRDALAIWPAFPGVRDEWLKLRGKYQVLRVAVPELPQNLVPGQTTTDTEKQLLDLLYEPLIRQEYNERLGQLYRPVLATNVPNSADGKLEFRLRPTIRWSDGTKVTDTTVRTSWEALPQFRRKMIAWASSSPFEVQFRITKKTFDPLSLLTFYVVGPKTSPDGVPRRLGSGPYVYRGRKDSEGRLYAVFQANPFYVPRSGLGYTAIREIRCYVPQDPVADYFSMENPPDVLLGLSGRQVLKIRERAAKRVQRLPNRRVSFLALNHRRKALQNRTLRQALTAAIDRGNVLDVAFGGQRFYAQQHDILGPGMAIVRSLLPKASLKAHAVLNGPFPAESWAVAPEVPKRLHNPDRARAFFKRVGEKSGPLVLRLAYPSTDKQVAMACQVIRNQIERASTDLDLKIDLVPMSPHKLRTAVYKGNYDLAYMSWDYESEFYWLWPMFDPKATKPGGSNFLGYKNDANLAGALLSRMEQTDFKNVLRITHEIHAQLNERVPLIPLWQLDIFVIVRRGVRVKIDDPLHIFRNVAEWTAR